MVFTYALVPAFPLISQLYGLMPLPELQAATTDQILPMIKNDLDVEYIPEIYAEDAALGMYTVRKGCGKP